MIEIICGIVIGILIIASFLITQIPKIIKARSEARIALMQQTQSDSFALNRDFRAMLEAESKANEPQPTLEVQLALAKIELTNAEASKASAEAERIKAEHQYHEWRERNRRY